MRGSLNIWLGAQVPRMVKWTKKREVFTIVIIYHACETTKQHQNGWKCNWKPYGPFITLIKIRF
jgi:hypothetical protein